MARAPVDTALVRRVILGAIGQCDSLKDAKEQGLYVTRQRDRAIELCMPLAPRTVERMTTIPWASRVEFADLEAAALLGIVEGIDSFQPRHSGAAQVSTHLWFRIVKRIYEEVEANHWTIMRPPRDQVRPYMKGAMSEDERHRYIATFVRPVIDPEPGREAHDSHDHDAWSRA